MKPYLKALKVVNIAWLAFVFLILILAAIPVIPGTVVIKLPGAEGWTTTEVGGVINITGNVSVYNGGVFPLDNFFFFMLLMNQDGNQVANFASPVISLPAGPTTTFPVYFEFQNTEAASVDIQKLFFSRATFTGMVYFNANYIFQFNI